MKLFKKLFNKLFKKKEEKEQLVVSKYLPVGVSKVEHYQGIVYTLLGKALEQRVYTIVLSAEFAPILCFVDMEREKPDYSKGEYLFGTKDGIEIYISPKYTMGGKIGNVEVVLMEGKY